jgi:hypothetical protein
MSTATTRSLTNFTMNHLGRILFFDAATCLLMGLLLVFAPEQLSSLLVLPSSLLLYAGILLFPCVALMAFAGKQSPASSILVWLVILGNLAWVVASILVITVWFSPNNFGLAFVMAQAVVVAILALLEYQGLKNR